YNMGGWNGAICVASRTMLNTGLFIWDAQKSEQSLKSDWVPKNKFWAQQLAAQGYDTYFTGKWHVKADANKVFATARHIRGGMPRQTPEGYNRPKADGSDPWDPSDPKFGGFWEGGTHWSEVVGNDALDYLDAAAKDDDPFFMYLAFNAPHDPRQAPKEFVDRYPLDKVAVPETFMPEYPWNEPMQSGRRLRDEKLAPFPRTEHSVKVNRQEYYAIITHMDEQIGRILDGLEKTGKADNTIIVFTADHGLACGHHGLLGKQNQFDHSIRVPFMISGPGIAAGKTNNTPIYYQDIMPTTLEAAGAPLPEYVAFKSLNPLLKGEKTAHHFPIYGSYVTGQRSITRGKDKLILYPKAKKALLFNLDKDPSEMHDLLPAGIKTARSLFADLLTLQHNTNDTLDLKTPFADLATED
ncbi:MAG: sulfatase-like hydrolase/transferase, partial [Verrucomicrobiales bacterium]|nr:sulfatase-like hydrolase/transferase [Verrucomicrobiales bacterium]